MLTQIGAMMFYEFRMHWRRCSLIVATLSMVVLSLLMIVFSRDTFSGGRFLSSDSVLPDIVPLFWVAVYMVALSFIGPMTADSIPIDRQVGVAELLDSLPLTHKAYLLGKIAGVFLSILVSLFLSMVIIGVGTWIVLGPYALMLFLRVWLVGALPIAFLNSTLGLLLAAGQPTRRRAIVIGSLLALLCLVAFASSARGIIVNTPMTLLDLLSVSRPAIMRFFMPSGSVAISSSDLIGTITFGLIQVAVLAIGVWGWMRLRDQRS